MGFGDGLVVEGFADGTFVGMTVKVQVGILELGEIIGETVEGSTVSPAVGIIVGVFDKNIVG